MIDVLYLFFFFQAEDGIRDKLVTGVQTCGLPILAAREVAVGALGTIYAIGGGDGAAEKIGQAIAGQWSLGTALALLAWYVFAPQCASTLAVIRRETGGWKWMWITFAYMLALAYAAALATYNIAVA